MCGICGGGGGGGNLTTGFFPSNVTGAVVGTPASNPFAGGPTTLTAGSAALAAAAPIAGTDITTTGTAKAGATAVSMADDCGCRRSFWQDLFVAVIIGVIVAFVVKKV